jgi:hypothetical protein
MGVGIVCLLVVLITGMQASKWLEAVELWHKLLMLVVTAFVEE